MKIVILNHLGEQVKTCVMQTEDEVTIEIKAGTPVMVHCFMLLDRVRRRAAAIAESVEELHEALKVQRL